MTAANQYPSIYHAIQAAAEARSQHTALNFITQLEPELESIEVSYRQLFASICQAGRLIKSLCDKPRPVASFLLPNIPQAHSIMWGAESVGVVNPLNPLLNEDALQNLMALADTDVVFALGPNPLSDIWQKTQAVVARLPNKPKLIPVFFAAEGYDLYEQLQAEQDAGPLPQEWLPGLDDIASYFHTGGTTGTPKLAQNSHRNQLACVSLHHESLEGTSSDKVINGLPLFHVAGSMINGLSALCAGMEMILPTMAGFRDPKVVKNHWKIVQRYGITVAGGIPTSVAAVLDVPVGDADISSLRFLISGGSPVSAALCHEVKRVLGLELYQIFGMTECAGGVAMPNIHKPTVPGSAGFVRAAVEVEILGAKKPGDSGELLVRGDVVFPGYLSVLESPLKDGWLHTGDLGHIDEEGNLFITGRAKDLIIRSGHNIDPALIENCLEQHPAVSMAAAVGKPDSYAGELPVAYVQLFEGHQVSSEELMAYAQANIAERPASPKFIEILPELPTTAVGKVHKPTLRGMAAAVLVCELVEQAGGVAELAVRQLDNGRLLVELKQVQGLEFSVVQGIAQGLDLDLIQL